MSKPLKCIITYTWYMLSQEMLIDRARKAGRWWRRWSDKRDAPTLRSPMRPRYHYAKILSIRCLPKRKKYHEIFSSILPLPTIGLKSIIKFAIRPTYAFLDSILYYSRGIYMSDLRFDRCILSAEKSPDVLDWPSLPRELPREWPLGPAKFREKKGCRCCLLLQLLLLLHVTDYCCCM